MEMAIVCLLIAINFDDELLTLQPIDDFYIKDDFIANLKDCELTPKEMKAVK